MEAMRLKIDEIRRASKERLLIAQVRAVSRERVDGSPRAIVRMRILIEDPGPGTTLERLRRLARAEALRFLDPA